MLIIEIFARGSEPKHRPTPRRPRSESTPHDAVIADPAPHRSAPFSPALARRHTGLRDQQDWPVIAPNILSSNV